MMRIVGVAVVELVLLIGAVAIWVNTRPFTQERIIAIASREPGWRVTVDYRPGQPGVGVTLQMDDLARFHTVQYQVESREPWLSLWSGSLSGHLSEMLTLRDTWRTAPRPMTASFAGQIALSVRVHLTEDGQDRVVDFAGAAFATPASWLDATFLNPSLIRLVYP